MSEKEELMNNINKSAGIMQALSQKESVASAVETRYNAAKKRSSIKRLIILLFIFVFPGIFMLAITKDLASLTYVLFGGGFVALLWFIFIHDVKNCESMLQKNKEEISQLLSNPLLSWLPTNYRDSYSYSKIAEYLTNMRASTLQEAINLLETENHQARVEYYTLLNKS